MADEKSHPLLQDPPPATSTPSAARPPRRAAPPLPPVLAFIVMILEHWTVNLLHNVALGFLTLDSLIATYRARSDPWTVAFVVCAYAVLMLFFWCIRVFERAPPARKGPLMVAICGLAMFLITLFSYRVASMMPFGFAVAIWIVAGIAIVAGFYAIFIFGRGVKAGNGRTGGEKTTEKEQQS